MWRPAPGDESGASVAVAAELSARSLIPEFPAELAILIKLTEGSCNAAPKTYDTVIN